MGEILQRQIRKVDRLLAVREQPEGHSFYPASLAAATLPYQDPGPDTLEWSRRAGNFELYVRAHRDFGMPYGVYPRLLTMWITNEIIRTKNRVIQLEGSYYAFLMALKLHTCGKIRRLFSAQADRLLTSAITYQRIDERRQRYVSAELAVEYEAWWNSESPSSKDRRIVIGEVFFNHVMNHAFPLDIRIVFYLKRCPLALDLYAWLTYRYYTVDRPTTISWLSIYNQFGAGIRDLKVFKFRCCKYLEDIKSVYPDANFERRSRHLILYPSRPSVAPKNPKYQLVVA